jgi:NAD(P)-dependent dehydrogenase (short-subunit alcohol dehydrogenase family)
MFAHAPRWLRVVVHRWRPAAAVRVMLAAMTVYDFDGKVALVTGGAGGIGSATVRQLVAGGARVAIADRDGMRAELLAEEFDQRALPIAVDISDEADIDDCAEAIVERFGRIDLHVLNAGIPGSLAPFEELSVGDFDEVIAVNVRGTFLGLRSAFRQFAAQRTGGAIVITGSICSLRGSDDLVPYHASKHAVLGLMRSAAVHGAARGVRVNGVAPGIVLTDLVAGSPEGAADATRRAHIAPQQRPGTTEEIADLITFLLSGNAGFLTGEMVSIDGGATAMNPVRHSGQQVAPR